MVDGNIVPEDEKSLANNAERLCDLVALKSAEIQVKPFNDTDSVGVDKAVETSAPEIDSPSILSSSSTMRDRLENMDADADPTLDCQPLQKLETQASSPRDDFHSFSAAKDCSLMHHSGDNPSEGETFNNSTGKENYCKVENGANSETEQSLLSSKLDTPSEHDARNNNFEVAEFFITDGNESGSDEEQIAFRKDVENFYRSSGLEFKAPKFYKEELNLLKLWKAVIKLGGYEQVTSCKLWRQVGESFRPPKTCTTVSWTFRIFYEKSLLEYEKHKLRSGELPFSDVQVPDAVRAENQAIGNQAHVTGRARRDAAARAMQGWHSQRLLDNGEVCHPVIKDKALNSVPKLEKQVKTNGAGLLKRKNPLGDENPIHITPMKSMKSQTDALILDVASPAEWVKVNVQKTVDCYEIYALVPGLLREEVHVQSDPAGRVIISGQPEQVDNPWGIVPFKKVVSLPTRIDPHHTSAVVTLHGQLFVRVPFETTAT